LVLAKDKVTECVRLAASAHINHNTVTHCVWQHTHTQTDREWERETERTCSPPSPGLSLVQTARPNRSLPNFVSMQRSAPTLRSYSRHTHTPSTYWLRQLHLLKFYFFSLFFRFWAVR